MLKRNITIQSFQSWRRYILIGTCLAYPGLLMLFESTYNYEMSFGLFCWFYSRELLRVVMVLLYF